MPEKTRRVSIYLLEAADHTQREYLAVRLEHQPGIELALPDSGDPHALRVEYEPGHFSEETLLDFISLQGFHARMA